VPDGYNVQGSGRGNCKALSRHFTAGTEESRKASVKGKADKA
jgi:hypothetical protein